MSSLLLFLHTSIMLFAQSIEAKTKNDDVKIILKLSPEQITNTFETIMSHDYIRKLAKEFAVQATQQLLEEMHTKKDEMVVKYIRNRVPENITTTDNHTEEENKASLDEREVLALLKAPQPDGDNQDVMDKQLTDSEEHSNDKIHVIQVQKINGKYFRRLAGL